MRPEDINRVDSEAGIIATLFHHPDFYYHAEDLLPMHFTVESNRAVYTGIMSLITRGIPHIDAYNIIECLDDSEATRRFAVNLSVGQIQELIDMSDTIRRDTIEEYKALVKNVMDASFRRDLFQKLKDCEAVCCDPKDRDVEQYVYQEIDSVMTYYSSSDDIKVYADVVDDMWDEIKSRQGTGYAGIPFKFPTLNEYVTIERGELVIFAAQQKVGKSIMLLNCAVDLLKRGYSVLYIDSELSTRLFTARLLTHLCGLEYRNVTSGNYSAEDEEKIVAAKDWMKEQKFTHLYMPFFDSQGIYTAVKKINHIQPLDVIIVDYFKSTGNEIDAFQTYASMGRCVDVIKNEIAGAMNIAAIGAAQATASNKLADSAKIARNASTIVMLMDKTPEEIEMDGPECGNKKMVVTVNRNGMQHAPGEYIDVAFDGNRILYEEARKQHAVVSPF